MKIPSKARAPIYDQSSPQGAAQLQTILRAKNSADRYSATTDSLGFPLNTPRRKEDALLSTSNIDSSLSALADIQPKGLSRTDAQKKLNQKDEFSAVHLPSHWKENLSPEVKHRMRVPWNKQFLHSILNGPDCPWSQNRDGPCRVVGTAEIVLDGEDRLVPWIEHDFGADHSKALLHLQATHPISQSTAHFYLHQNGSELGTLFMPPLFLSGRIAGADSKSLRAGDILNRLDKRVAQNTTIRADDFSEKEYAILSEWTASHFDLQLPRHACHRAFLALFNVDLSKATPQQIKELIETHEALGTLSGFSAQTLHRLYTRYSLRPPTDAEVFARVHLKHDAIVLLLARQILNIPLDLEAASGSYHPGILALEKLGRKQATFQLDLTQKKVVVLKRMDTLETLAKKYPAKNIQRALDSDQLRITAYNRADRQKLESEFLELAAKSLNETKPKRAEALLIGRRMLPFLENKVEQKWGTSLVDQTLVVVGAGLIGGGLVEAALEAGFPKKLIKIIDTDESVRKSYRERGFCAESPSAKTLSSRAVVALAASGASVNLDTMFDFAQDTMLVALTSGAKAVEAVRSPVPLTVSPADSGFGVVVKNDDGLPPIFHCQEGADFKRQGLEMVPDIDFWRDGRSVRLLAKGRSLHPKGDHQPFELTSCLIAAHLVEQWLGDGELIHPDEEKALMDTFAQVGCNAAAVLNPPSRSTVPAPPPSPPSGFTPTFRRVQVPEHIGVAGRSISIMRSTYVAAQDYEDLHVQRGSLRW